ncbi:MAG: hypothetical protein QXR35_05590 [Candidatus Korarchaeum sp.]
MDDLGHEEVLTSRKTTLLGIFLITSSFKRDRMLSTSLKNFSVNSSFFSVPGDDTIIIRVIGYINVFQPKEVVTDSLKSF